MLNKYNVETKFHKQQIVTKNWNCFLSLCESTIFRFNRFRKYWASWIVLRMLCTFAEQSKHFQQRGKETEESKETEGREGDWKERKGGKGRKEKNENEESSTLQEMYLLK